MGAAQGPPEGVTLKLKTCWMKRSLPREEWGTVFQAGGTVFQAEGTEGRKDQLGWSGVMEEDREVGRAVWAVEIRVFCSKGSRKPLKVLSWD